MSYWEKYVQPGEVEEALAALAAADGRGRIIAGGTDLLLDLQQGRQPPVEVLVDVAHIAELREIRIDGDSAVVGASVTHAAIMEHPVLKGQAAALVEACSLIGGPQVRSVATLGGNVAHALPAADGTIALLALDAQAQIASPAGRRWSPLAELFAGPGETTFDRTREVLVGFSFPLCGDGEASAFGRVMRPQGVAIAILNMAVWVRLDAAAGIADIRIACGPAGPVPFRALRAERNLAGKRWPIDDWPSVEAVLLDEVRLRTSAHRATQGYRRHLIGVLMRRVVRKAHRDAISPVPELSR
jgi:carbon-monoxide dehydrogenase medium subunit